MPATATVAAGCTTTPELVAEAAFGTWTGVTGGTVVVTEGVPGGEVGGEVVMEHAEALTVPSNKAHAHANMAVGQDEDESGRGWASWPGEGTPSERSTRSGTFPGAGAGLIYSPRGTGYSEGRVARRLGSASRAERPSKSG